MSPAKYKFLGSLLQTLLLFALAVPALAQPKDWEREWAEVVAAAKKEGRVVVEGTPDPVTRREIPSKFEARFGVPVEYMAGRGGDVTARIRTERRAGVYSTDVYFGGLTNLAVMYQEKVLDPVKPILLLPDVLDPAKWKKGSLWFSDPEERYILRLFNFVSTKLHINTHYVSLAEMKSIQGLLQPKWRGRISADDPTLSGSGGFTAATLYAQHGEELLKKLYIDQKPFITRERRLLTDSLARGTYPISLDAPSGEVKRLQEEGFPLKTFYSLPDSPGRLSAGSGLVALLNKAPHPNAARLFINWIASREGLELYSKARLIPTTRNDVDESFLPPEIVPRPGQTYFDAYSWNFTTVESGKIKLRVKELLKR